VNVPLEHDVGAILVQQMLHRQPHALVLLRNEHADKSAADPVGLGGVRRLTSGCLSTVANHPVGSAGMSCYMYHFNHCKSPRKSSTGCTCYPYPMRFLTYVPEAALEVITPAQL
jgi:hypothetical protein